MSTRESRPHLHHPDPVLITLSEPKSAASEAFRGRIGAPGAIASSTIRTLLSSRPPATPVSFMRLTTDS